LGGMVAEAIPTTAIFKLVALNWTIAAASTESIWKASTFIPNANQIESCATDK
jgi:hypothetical protein